MYVCMYVCMYVGINIFRYICRYLYMYGSFYLHKYARNYLYIYIQTLHFNIDIHNTLISFIGTYLSMRYARIVTVLAFRIDWPFCTPSPLPRQAIYIYIYIYIAFLFAVIPIFSALTILYLIHVRKTWIVHYRESVNMFRRVCWTLCNFGV